jgi:predicted lipoprotein with Yx(FWY)xxD motif
MLSAPVVLAAEYVGGAIKTMTIDGKEVLTDANGMTLYTFDKDAEGVSNCYDKCADNWPPLFAAEGAAAEGEFTLVTRTDGKMMWAYDGKPLYLWVKDEKPGDTTGDGVGEVWHTAIDD